MLTVTVVCHYDGVFVLLVVHYDRHLSPQFLSVEGLGHELAIASRDQQKAIF